MVHKIEKCWQPSEEKALLELKDFIKKIENYSDARNFPAL